MTYAKARSLGGSVKESETRRQALALHQTGVSLEVILAFMRERGFDQPKSINFLVRHLLVPVQKARTLVKSSHAWSDRFEEDQEFHDELIKATIKAGFILVPSVNK